ncbi:MAG: translation initiation factor IF-3 [Armatimonadota bacterium]
MLQPDENLLDSDFWILDSYSRRCVNINKQLRVNERIRVREVRLIDEEGHQAGIVQTRDALQQAKDAGLDLIEVSPNATPPVCRIMDYGKFKYEQAKRDKVAHQKSKQSELHLIRVRPSIDDHDYAFKLKNARKFLEDGDKVRIFVIFRSREFTHPELGRKLLQNFVADLTALSHVEKPIGMEGRQMSVVLAPEVKAKPPKPPKAASKPKPAAAPKPAGAAETPAPEETPKVVEAPEPTETPKAVEAPEPTETPKAVEAPEPEVTPTTPEAAPDAPAEEQSS